MGGFWRGVVGLIRKFECDDAFAWARQPDAKLASLECLPLFIAL